MLITNPPRDRESIKIERRSNSDVSHLLLLFLCFFVVFVQAYNGSELYIYVYVFVYLLKVASIELMTFSGSLS